MLYLKVFHLVFVISWMACLFYLPRIFVHYAEGKKNHEDVRRVGIMARKLGSFSLFTGFFAISSGLGLMFLYGFSGWWLNAKIFFVFLLAVYQYLCLRETGRIHRNLVRPPVFYRFANEVVLLLLIPILYFVVFKPFY